MSPLAGAHADGTLTKADYESCQTHDESAFRTAIEAITLTALKRSLAGFEYAPAVSDAWRAAGMDDIIDKRVDIAIADVGNETSWSDKLQSLAYSEKSQSIAKAVAERVYRSDTVKAGIESVAADVGRKLGSSLEFASQDAAGPAIACVKAFLGPRYGSAVAGAVTAQAEKEFALDASKGQATVGAGAVLAQSGDGVAGAAILIVRRSLANMAQRIGQRIVGSVLSRLVSVAAGGIGAVLIAKDIWELRAGVFPIIATEMKSKTTKEQVQTELAKSVSEQIGDHVKEVAGKTSDRIVEIWQDFRRAHVKALELADRNPDFRTFLDLTKPANLPRLDEIVALVLAGEGEAGLLGRLKDGTLDTAVNALPAPAMEIARETRSIDTALKWTGVAGDLLPKVIENEIYRQAAPADFTRGSLAKLIALDDKVAISRLAALKSDARATLFELNTADLKSLARALSENELGTLSGYLTGLESHPRERILKAIAMAPGKMRILASARVRDAVLASRDQTSAVDMMLRADAGSPQQIIADAKLAFEGAISPILIWERHPIMTALAVIPVLVFVLLVWRIFGGRNPKPAVKA